MKTDLRKIIAMPLFGIGDVLMCTPALRNLKEQTGAHVTFLHMFKTTWEMLQGNPYVDENVHFPFLSTSKLASVKFLLSLRGKYDASVNFYPSNRRDYSLAAFLTGCPQRVGHRYRERDLVEMNFLKNRTVMEDDTLHNVQENLRLLGLLGIERTEPYPLELYLRDEEKLAAAETLKGMGVEAELLIGFHPGTSTFKNHTRKRWPTERFASLIRTLADLYPRAAFLLMGGPEERPVREQIRDASGTAERTVIIETDSIRQTSATISLMNAFVSNDSGLMHIAAALQVPTVALFGPTNPAWVGPWMCPHSVITCGEMACRPCFRYSPTSLECSEQLDFSCLGEITVAQVMEHLGPMLKRP